MERYHHRKILLKALLISGTVFTVVGYVFCIAGFSIASDFLNFSLKMPKNNLIKP